MPHSVRLGITKRKTTEVERTCLKYRCCPLIRSGQAEGQTLHCFLYREVLTVLIYKDVDRPIDASSSRGRLRRERIYHLPDRHATDEIEAAGHELSAGFHRFRPPFTSNDTPDAGLNWYPCRNPRIGLYGSLTLAPHGETPLHGQLTRPIPALQT